MNLAIILRIKLINITKNIKKLETNFYLSINYFFNQSFLLFKLLIFLFSLIFF